RKLLYWHFQKEVEQRLLVFADGSGIAGKIEGVPYWWHANFWPPWGRVAQAPTAQCRIAYEKDGDIFIRNCDGSGARRITSLAEDESAPGSPAWSPDGEYIVFHSGHESQPEESGWVPPNLYIIRADGSDLTPLTSGNHSDLFPAWSPDGSRIAFHRACSLVTIAANGSNLTMIAPESDQICANVPTWSPDGQRIAFSSWKPGSSPKESSREIYVVNSDGTDLRKLAHFEVSEVWTTWSSDGQQIGVQAQGTDNVFKYYLVNADGSGEPVEIESIPESWYPWYWPQWDRAPQMAAPDAMAEQARAFAEPILQAIADRKPNFEDDFSTAGKGWVGGNLEQNELAVVQNGVARLEVKEKDVSFGNEALNRKDFVLQVDARVAEGDKATQLIVNFHNLSGEYWFYVVVNSAGNTWLSDKHMPGDQRNLANGSGNVSPFGETTRIMIVARGPRAAVYLNDTPVAYFEDADFDTSGGTGLFCQSIRQAVCEFDNVKFWNLNNVPGLP
ncbi:MAG TPA: hypothetical protein VJ020_09945, partial [Anaerolineales bacterium]|nr:hypothetical protein [Anaerolineales bacterium]